MNSQTHQLCLSLLKGHYKRKLYHGQLDYVITAPNINRLGCFQQWIKAARFKLTNQIKISFAHEKLRTCEKMQQNW